MTDLRVHRLALLLQRRFSRSRFAATNFANFKARARDVNSSGRLTTRGETRIAPRDDREKRAANASDDCGAPRDARFTRGQTRSRRLLALRVCACLRACESA